MKAILAACYQPEGKFRIECNSCFHVYSVKPFRLGHHGKCQACGAEIWVPNPTYTVVIGSHQFLSVDFSKFRYLEQRYQKDLSECAVRSIDGEVVRCDQVFPCNTNADVGDKKLAEMLIDESVFEELRDLYPDKKNLLLYLTSGSTLISGQLRIWSKKRACQYQVHLEVRKTSWGSVLVIELSIDSQAVEVTAWKLDRTHFPSIVGVQPCITVAGQCVLIGSRGIEKILQNLKDGNFNHFHVNFRVTTPRGIRFDDVITIPCAAIERILIYHTSVFQTAEDIEEVESFSDVIFLKKFVPADLVTETEEEYEVGKLKIVYLLQNQSMPGIVKIGRTTQGVKKRMEQLNTTGVAMPYECFYAAFVEDDVATEKHLHDTFSDYRVNERREFFEISPAKVMRELFKFDLGDATDT